jgi:hypothetical protein
MIQQVKINRN